MWPKNIGARSLKIRLCWCTWVATVSVHLNCWCLCYTLGFQSSPGMGYSSVLAGLQSMGNGSHWGVYCTTDSIYKINSQIHISNTHVAVLGRNRTLFSCVFQPHYRIQSAIAHNFREGRSSYTLHTQSCIYAVHISPARNRSSVLQDFKCGNAVEICDWIMFDFYPGLPQIHIRSTHCYMYLFQHNFNPKSHLVHLVKSVTCTLRKCVMLYSGTPLMQTPWGPGWMSGI